jgi:predicted TIM-barrel fold metal-dependent hydrolase
MLNGFEMIDVHTHPFNPKELTICEHFERHGEVSPAVVEPFLRAMRDADKAIVLALWAPSTGMRLSNALVAAVVSHDPARLVGFASVHPNSPSAISELQLAAQELGLRGLKLAPIYQHFAPDDPSLWPFYGRIQELNLPIIWHQGASFLAPDGPLELAQPLRLDKVARDFPRIKMVIAHFGYPWSREVVAMLRKHANVYTDISANVNRPWFLYGALVDALEYSVRDKVLFGSDYPFFTANRTIEVLKHTREFARGTSLPQVPTSFIDEIIERDSLALLGLRS